MFLRGATSARPCSRFMLNIGHYLLVPLVSSSVTYRLRPFSPCRPLCAICTPLSLFPCLRCYSIARAAVSAWGGWTTTAYGSTTVSAAATIAGERRYSVDRVCIFFVVLLGYLYVHTMRTWHMYACCCWCAVLGCKHRFFFSQGGGGDERRRETLTICIIGLDIWGLFRYVL